MQILDDKTIKLDRELSDLDIMVLDFIRVLSRFADYVCISGYVAILFGRSRGTEDIDFFIERLSFEQFHNLYSALLEQGYWALNGDDEQELFSMLNDSLAIRFAVRGKVIPNFEVKFVKDKLDQFSLKTKVKVITKGGTIFTSLLELQIAYKKFVLKSPKDIEDAKHLEKIFSISEENIKKYKLLLKQYGRI